MKQDLFTYLPSEIISNILLRLPIQAIATSKCVCKAWLHLLESDEFVNSHLAKSVPALAVLTAETDSSSCTVFKFEDGHDLEPHHLHYHPLFKLDFPHGVEIKGSANGLLFLYKQLRDESEALYVCNPITREYIELRFPEELIHPNPKSFNHPEILQDSVYSPSPSITYGFGASKISGQHKVVRIYHASVFDHRGEAPRIIPESECHVYTLGAESWRRVQPGARFEYSSGTSCVFLNGSLHWIGSDSDKKLWISCFDLETERFSSFSTPLVLESPELIPDLSALGDCLCLCDHTVAEETAIWMMKEYGVEKSWTKEYDIIINEYLDIEAYESVYPLKVFKDGDVLMLREGLQLFYYSKKTQTAQEIGFFPDDIESILLTPSFLSLKSFGVENVVSF